jgi:uncharacterized membrane protein
LGSLSPTGINSWGQVVGNLNGHAFIWTLSGSRDLGTLAGGTFSNALAINDFAAVVGTADGLGTVISQDPNLPNQECSSLVQPFVWSPSKGMKGLGTVGVPGEIFFPFWCELPFYATSINNFNQVVGYTTAFGDLYQWAFLRTRAKGMNLFGSSFPPTMINQVSNTGEIVGQTGILIGRATSWRNGVTTSLSDLGGGIAYYSSSAIGVNDQGQIVGWSTTTPILPDCESDLSGCPMHAVLWARSGSILDLGTLPGDSFSTASNINFLGQVIGTSGDTLVAQGWGGTGGSGFEGEGGVVAVVGRPFIWSASSGMQDLNTLISSGSGWVLNSATGINFWGQIVGSGTLNGQIHGFLLTPKRR